MIAVYAPPAPLHVGRYRTCHLTTTPLTPETAMRIVTRLDADGIHVAARIRRGTTVELIPIRPVTTRQRVKAVAAFVAKTDAPIRWGEVE